MRWQSIRQTGRPGASWIESSERCHWYFRDGRGTISVGLTSHPADDGFHEIQLNGKQLVFLFMAATVVSVVIFLCGVLVGRGVRADRGSLIAEVPTADPIATGGSSEAATAIPSVAPPAAYEHPSAIERLEDKGNPGLDELKPMAPKPPTEPAAAAPGSRPAPVAVSTAPPPAKPAPPSAKPAPAPAAKPAQPAGAKTTPPAPASGTKSGYVVQLAALNSRSEADAMAKRLSAKGYEAYVQAPADNAPAIFRVRVGTYPTRTEAENAAARLEKEGKFKPWVAAR